MWHWALDLARMRRARRIAHTVISPMVESSSNRLGGIPDSAWSDPYIVGFTIMLITVVARIEIGTIEGEALCFLQARAWKDITKRDDEIGEEVLLMSTARNRDFELGCRNAVTFGSMLAANSILTFDTGRAWRERHPDLQDSIAADAPIERDDVATVWEQFFDAHIARSALNDMHAAHTAI
ncbi:hypothetical protein ACSVBT_14555 [Afipia sp. TerB]